MEMGGKVGIVKKHFPHGGKGGSKCGLKHYLDEIQTLMYQNFRQSTDFENQSEEWKNELITPVNFMARYAPPLWERNYLSGDLGRKSILDTQFFLL